MKTDIKQLGPCKRLLQIEVSLETITDKIGQIYKEFGQKARVPGFRLGKAPRHVLELHYKEQVKKEALERLIADSYRQAIKESSLVPVSYPEITEVKFKEFSPLLFKALVDIRPAIKLGNYLGIKVSEKKTEVTDKDVEKTLTDLQQANARYVVIEDRPVKMDDYVSIDLECIVDKKVIEKKKNFRILVSTKSYLPELGEALVGMERSQEKTVDLTLPADFQKKEYALKKAIFIIFLNEIKERKIPAIDDQLAKSFGGYDNLDELKEAIKKNLIERARIKDRMDLKNQIINQLLKNSRFALPDSLLKRQTDRLVEEKKKDLLYQGIKKEDIEAGEKDLRNNLKEESEGQIRLAFILEEIADIQKIKVSQQDVEQRIDQMAVASHQDRDKVRQYLEKEGLLDNLKSEIGTAKTLDFLLEKAQK